MALFESRPQCEPIKLTPEEKLTHKYVPGTLITFFLNSPLENKPFLVTARVAEDVGNVLHVSICSMGNDFCKNMDKENPLQLINVPKKNVLHVFMCMPNGQCSAAAAGGAKKKSRRRKANKASKTKRKSRRLKRTTKRRA